MHWRTIGKRERMCVSVCVCVCLCARKRKRERESFSFLASVKAPSINKGF